MEALTQSSNNMAARNKFYLFDLRKGLIEGQQAGHNGKKEDIYTYR